MVQDITMDTLTKKKEIRQKLQRKLASQSAEIRKLKDQCSLNDREIKRLGGVYIDNDGRTTRIAFQMAVSNHMLNEHHENVWEDLVCELGINIGRKIASEKTKQAFKDGLGTTHEMREAMNRWLYHTMKNASIYANLSPMQLESAWNSALQAIMDYAKRN